MCKLFLPLLVSSLVLQSPASGQAPSVGGGQSDLATGIRQVDEGDLEAAVITLDTAVQRLKQEKGREKDLAAAHLYLAMAHLGLSQWERAKGEMREAWRNDQQLTLDPKKFPPRVVQLYEQTKQEAKHAEAASPQPIAAPRPVPTAAPPKGGGSKAPILIGVGVAAGAGIAVAAAGGGSAPSPTPAPTPTPPIGSVTTDLQLNGQDSGSFSCQGGLFFTVLVKNTTQQSVRVERFDLDFAVVSGSCRNHTPAGLDGSAVDPRDVPSGATLQVRRVDLAGSLCSPPNGAVGCQWRANLSVTTSAGKPTDTLSFTTSP